MNSILQESLADVCGLLSQRHIRFALVGGIAASLRGRLRATEDVDLVLLTATPKFTSRQRKISF